MSDPQGQSRGQTAVALLYEKPRAPRVVAKGRGEIGQAIVDAARNHGVPLEHNPALAEALSQVELESEIPHELYKAVSIVLGFILRASGRLGPAPPR
ncbi:MAG: EscU/YscU/HrcU family type III secretion system export apparatus switch protein [Caulobacteraceae bacterium]|nr:EscU/YscU/HrcU family type III secretion system export apparatus switch protein [Caulobacteraceae bacterium]